MGITYTTVTIKPLSNTGKSYKAEFLVDTGAIDCVVPAKELEEIGVERTGQKMYELADSSRVRFDFGLIQIEVMDEITAGRVVFGPEETDPILGVTALESAALKVNPVTNEVEKLPASLLK
ncbi:MAG: hypothetical protein P9X24_02085 [Candidatus Hatepunaea meridiana]|nr:hypothetical protein [Candidatus Hatepunaea meridiana]